MKLNGLTNNLAGNDKSLSNSYLSHIVELLRQEVATLTAKENALEAITTEHIETQKEVVDTKTVNAEKVNTASINDKIILTDVINVLTNLKVNGKDVLTDATFQGPFTYKGVVVALPSDAAAGDVYITNDKVNIYNGTGWDEFVLPAGTVSLAEYNKDKSEMLTEISNVQNDLNETKIDLTATNSILNEAIIDINDINTKLETKVDEAPKDSNSYVRKNGEWVEQTAADNTVKHIAGVSVIDNTEAGVTINSPKVEITTPDFKINGSELPEVDKLALTKTTVADTDYHYELKFGRSPFDATSSIRSMYSGYGNEHHAMAKAAPEQFSVFTKNFQWVKWGSALAGADNAAINITAMDKDGNINLIPNNFIDWTADDTTYLQNTCFITFNQEYVPEGWDDTVYLFNPGKPYLAELKDGKFSRKIDLYNKVGGLKEQGYKPSQFAPGYSRTIGLVGGKGLRNKEIQRICMVCFDTANIGGSWVIIIGGDKNSNTTDPFDPTKCIYVHLPATAYYSYACMAATDSAWYLQENGTGRMMRITPNGQVVELNLTETVVSSGYNYIEYTDKNNRPACAYYVQNKGSNGGHYVVFVEEGENGQVSLIERKVESEAFTPTGNQWYAQLFKFIENSHYIFFTADCGFSPSEDAIYGSASMKNILWYWDKKTHTTHAINNFYEGLKFGEHDFIEMHKTKGNAIWFPYLIQGLVEAKRTGELHFISDVDYTEIDEATGKDIGEIQVQSATVGTDHAFFTCNSTGPSRTMYTHGLQSDSQGSQQWSLTMCRNQLSATNDDGILCIMSGDDKSIALCYGDGNIKVYPISSGSDAFDCDADKEPYAPEESPLSNASNASQVLYSMEHGWVLRVLAVSAYTTALEARQSDSYTYIGVHYRNGEPTILTAPHLSKILRCGYCPFAQRTKWEKYAYLQTYDDYERRKKVLSGIRAHIGYGGAATGADGFFKEVREETKKLNLTYNGKVISSVDD